MRLLIVEDDIDLARLMRINLEKQGYAVDLAEDGEEGLRLVRQRAHDMVLLDRMLPRLDGLSLLRAARAEGIATPVVMMTALGSLGQVVDGLDEGADDYVVKPFAVGELLARVRAVARRPVAMRAGADVVCGALRLMPGNKQLCWQNSCCSLSKRECDLLEALMKSAGQTLARQALFGYVWGPDAPVEDANLDNYIRFARQRLREVGAQATITTVRGVGYRLEVEDG